MGLNYKTLDHGRLIPFKLNIFSTIASAFIVLLIIFANTNISKISLRRNQLQTHRQNLEALKITSPDDDISGPENKLKPEELEFFVSTEFSRRFGSRVGEFFQSNQCRVQIFMTWISPADAFGEREFFGLESLFRSNPGSCLIILSRTLDSEQGGKILDPLTNLGFLVRAITPDFWALIKNTPAEAWFNDMKAGRIDPGEIPLAQNLSNLIRLAALYKYGGVYLDTDFIILKDLSRLRNSIGAQSTNTIGKWTRLNNAVLVFDKNHPLVCKFMEEFASTFNGNKWGYNGPYLVSRVVSKVARREGFDFTVLPPMAFYPVDWTRVDGFFVQPNDRVRERWVKAKIRQLNGSSYGVHLWNSQSSRFKIEQGSVIDRLISHHCVICRRDIASSLSQSSK